MKLSRQFLSSFEICLLTIVATIPCLVSSRYGKMFEFAAFKVRDDLHLLELVLHYDLSLIPEDEKFQMLHQKLNFDQEYQKVFLK